MIYDVRHLTTVQYATPVQLARFNLRLKPAPWPGQSLQGYSLTIDPVPWSIEEHSGPFVVNRSRMTLRQPLRRLTIDSRFRLDVTAPASNPGRSNSPTVAHLRERAALHRDLSPMGPASYLYPSAMAPTSAAIAAWAAPFFQPGTPVLEAAHALMGAINAEFAYDGEATTADTLPDESFHARHGVCQDFAHVMIVAARSQGVPAAYVSGYLRTLPPPGRPRLIGVDATHAWACIWCGDALGWLGFDPTNNVMTGTDHIFTAMGRDYLDVSPLDGVFRGGAGQTMKVSVDVSPVSV